MENIKHIIEAKKEKIHQMNYELLHDFSEKEILKITACEHVQFSSKNSFYEGYLQALDFVLDSIKGGDK
jgi:hypothetical protein